MQKQSLPVKDVAQHGVNTDLPEWLLPPGAFTTGFNFRIVDGFIEATGSGNDWDTAPVTSIGLLLYVNSTSGRYWLLAGEADIYAYDGSVFNVITPAGLIVNDKDDWTGCLLTNIPIVNTPSSAPYYWPIQSPSNLIEELPWDATRTWSDVNESCRIMRSHKQFLFAMDLQSGVNQITDGVRWSTPADIGSIPESWDHLDVTKVAGLTNLGGAGGRIIDGLSMRDAFIIYRENGISVFDYVGGQFVWQIRNMAISTGLISADSITEVKGSHFFIGDGDIYGFDGNKVTSILYGVMKDLFSALYNPATYSNCYAVKNEVRKEIWFCVPALGGFVPGVATNATYPNVAFIYNWKEGTWGVRQITEAPAGDYGPRVDNGDKWDDIGTGWDSQGTRTWELDPTSPIDDTIVTVTDAGVLRFEDRLDGAIDSSYTFVLFRSTLQISQEPGVTTIQSIYPSIKLVSDAAATIDIRVGSHDTPIDSPYAVDDYAVDTRIRWKDVSTFTPDAQRKSDRKTTGEYHALYLSAVMHSTGNISDLKYAGHVFEFVGAGLR